MQWIEIPNWDRFQHYKDRDPIWIKTFIRQIRDDDYLALSYPQRGLLHDIRMLYAEANGQLTYDGLTTKIGGQDYDKRTLRRHVEALNHAGFIRFRASKPVRVRKRQRHKELADMKNTPKNTPRPHNGRCPICNIHVPKGSLSDHMRNQH